MHQSNDIVQLNYAVRLWHAFPSLCTTNVAHYIWLNVSFQLLFNCIASFQIECVHTYSTTIRVFIRTTSKSILIMYQHFDRRSQTDFEKNLKAVRRTGCACTWLYRQLGSRNLYEAHEWLLVAAIPKCRSHPLLNGCKPKDIKSVLEAPYNLGYVPEMALYMFYLLITTKYPLNDAHMVFPSQ